MTNLAPIAFYALGGLSIACALLVVLKKNPVACAFNLVLLFAGFAGIYATLDAHLIAAIQILVYAGAIMVLFVFVIMLLAADEPSFDMGRSNPIIKGAVGLACALMVVAFIWALRNSAVGPKAGAFTVAAIEASGGNSKVISQMMFSKYVLPFELTSVLLLAAIVGAVAIAKRKTVGKEQK